MARQTSEAYGALASPTAKSPKKELRSIEMKEGEKGGHVVTHHFEHYNHDSEVYPFGKSEGKQLVAHIVKHMGIDMGEQKAASTTPTTDDSATSGDN